MTPRFTSPRMKMSATIGVLSAVTLLAFAQLAGAALPKFQPGAPPKADTTKKAAPAPTTPAPAPATTAAPAPTGAGAVPATGATPAGAAAAGAAGAAGLGATSTAPPPVTTPATKVSAPLSAQERAALRTEVDRALRSMADSLKLTPTQRSQARPILLDHAYQVKQLRERYATQERTQPVIESMQRDLKMLRDTTDSKMGRVLHSNQMAAYMAHRDQWLSRLRTRMGVTAPNTAATAPPPTQPVHTPTVTAPATTIAHPAGTNAPATPAGTSVPSHPAGVSAPVDTTHHK